MTVTRPRPTPAPAPAALTRRQLQAHDTRKRLFTAASELFAAHGYHETTVEAIVQRAGVAKGTFFLHFATKDAVVTDLVAAQVRVARRARARALAEAGPVAALRAAVMALGEQAGLSRGVSRAVLAATLENQQVGGATDALFREVLGEMVADARAGQAAGLLTRRVTAETIANALMASYLGAALHCSSSPHALPLVTVLVPLVEANLNGFEEAPHAKDSVPPVRRRRARPRRVR